MGIQRFLQSNRMMPKTGGHGEGHCKVGISVQFGGDGYLYIGDRLVPKPAARKHRSAWDCPEWLCHGAESESD